MGGIWLAYFLIQLGRAPADAAQRSAPGEALEHGRE
jgi:hypothetical protein